VYYVKALNGDQTELNNCIQGAFAEPAAAGGATVTSTYISNYTAGQTTTSSTLTAITGGTDVTLTEDGKCLMTATVMVENNTNGRSTHMAISDDGSAVGKSGTLLSAAGGNNGLITIGYTMANDGSDINLMWKTDGVGTSSLTNGAGVNTGCSLSVLEVS